MSHFKEDACHRRGYFPSDICSKANEILLTGEILKSESHAILPTRNCHSWRQVRLSFTFLCSMLDLKRKLNMWAIFQKRVLTEDSFAFCVRVLLFIDKALSKLRM